jgi:MFS family permease
MGHRAELTYFGLLGLGFMLVEVPLLQRFILFLGHPAYAMTTVLFAILFFSGIGSALSRRIGTRLALALLIGLIGVYAVGLPWLFARTLALPLSARMLAAVLALAPAGLLMGMPFPQGLRRLSALAARPELLLPWAWGINGALSVVASVLAALLALSFGFDVVLLCGALCYAGAWLVAGQGIDGVLPLSIAAPVNGTKVTPPIL